MIYIKEMTGNYLVSIFIFLFMITLVLLFLFLKRRRETVNTESEIVEKFQSKRNIIEISGDKWIGKRESQEDAFAILSQSESEYLSVLADGMGGHSNGQVASQFTVDRFLDLYTKEKNDITKIIERINSELLNFSENVVSKNDVGTTLVVCEIIGTEVKFFSVGDSSIYIVTSEYIKLLNKHQKKGMYLTNYIGYENFIEEGIEKIELNFDEILKDKKNRKRKEPLFIFLCSDGLDKYLETGIIKDTIIDNMQKSSYEIVDIIMEKLKNRGRIKQDNASIILIKVNGHY